VNGLPLLARFTWGVPVVVVALVASDLLFAVLNAMTVDASGEVGLPRFLHVSAEWTVPEVIQYAKWMLVAVTVAGIYRVTREKLYGPWALAFGYAGIDDATGLHERIGRVLSEAIARQTGTVIPPGYLELAWISAIVLLFLIVLRRATSRAEPTGESVRYTRLAVALSGVYALFAIGLDAVQSVYGAAVPSDRRGETLLGILENSGELVALSLIVALSLREAALVIGARAPARHRSASSQELGRDVERLG
jgi:hypothetical protein